MKNKHKEDGVQVYFRNVTDIQRAAKVVQQFIDEYPPDHKQCAFVSERFSWFVQRTKAGNITINQLNEPA